MQDSFDYLCVKESLDSISVDDSGNTILLACNDEAVCWYLKTETDMGTTVVTQFGPLANGGSVERLGRYGFNYNQLELDYNEKKLHKIIDKFLNDTSRQITQVMEIDDDQFYYKLEELKKQL